MPSPLAALADLLAPDRCIRCGERASAPWCGRCEPFADRLRIAQACDRCGLAGGDDEPHGCWPAAVAVARTSVVYRYTDVIADAIVAGKVTGRSSVWPGLGARLADVVATVASGVLVTWVPTEPRRRRDRGFDHAEVLARSVADRLGGAVAPTLRARPGATDRGSIAPGLRDRDRPVSFRRRPHVTPSAGYLLVDDVLTTGATVRAACLALAEPTVAPVHVAVVARAGRHPLDTVGPSLRGTHDAER